MKKKNLLMTAIVIFGLATITMAQVPPYVPTNGLVGWWPFNGNANDESGNGNNGTVNGATLSADRFGNVAQAYSFDGYNDEVRVPNQSVLNLIGDFSISGWYKTSVFPSYNTSHTIIGKRDDGLSCCSPNVPYHLSVNYAQNGVDFRKPCLAVANGSYNFCQSDSTVSLYQWINIALTYSFDTCRIYMNGILSHAAFFSNSYRSPNSSDLLIGSINRAYGDEYMNGQLDDIGIWNRALTQQEITDLYNGCQLSVNTQPTNQTININNNAQFVVGSSDPGVTYQWQTDLGVGFQNLSNAGQYSGVTTGTLTVSNVTMSNNNQNFRCIVSSGSCSDTSNVAVLTVNNNVGINEISQDKLFSVFPNPVQCVINVKAASKLIGSVYSIYDNTGRVVLSGKLNDENAIIELGDLSGGIYMFSVGENMKQTFKVIKE